MNTIFDQFESGIVIKKGEFYHILISVDAVLSPAWGELMRDEFPLSLALEFNIVQENDFMQE